MCLNRQVYKRNGSKKLRLDSRGDFELMPYGDGSAAYSPAVAIRKNDATIGCHTVTREAVEKLYGLFVKHFPNNEDAEVKIQ